MAERTVLSPDEEQRFRAWVATNQIFRCRSIPTATTTTGATGRSTVTQPVAFGNGSFHGHVQQHGHPRRSSVESQYSAGPFDGGRWRGRAVRAAWGRPHGEFARAEPFGSHTHPRGDSRAVAREINHGHGPPRGAHGLSALQRVLRRRIADQLMQRQQEFQNQITMRGADRADAQLAETSALRTRAGSRDRRVSTIWRMKIVYRDRAHQLVTELSREPDRYDADRRGVATGGSRLDWSEENAPAGWRRFVMPGAQEYQPGSQPGRSSPATAGGDAIRLRTTTVRSGSLTRMNGFSAQRD